MIQPALMRWKLINNSNVLSVAAVCIAIGATIWSGALLAQSTFHPPAEAAALAGQHPAQYYRTAARLFSVGKRDDAVFIFYLGQLRYRIHLSARRAQLKPDGDPALFASLSEFVGRPLNEYAFGDIPTLARIIDEVLAYDAANPDKFTPPSKYASIAKNVRDGLSSMKARVLRNAESIRMNRTKNGLKNRR